jgi:hypothetical protein
MSSFDDIHGNAGLPTQAKFAGLDFRSDQAFATNE